jgi:hypothetical protein
MRQLVNSWIAAERELHQKSLAEAIRRMNDKRGCRLTHSRVAEWRRGVYVPSQVAISQMLYRTLPWALEKAGIQATNDQMRALESLLWITFDKDGQRGVELL